MSWDHNKRIDQQPASGAALCDMTLSIGPFALLELSSILKAKRKFYEGLFGKAKDSQLGTCLALYRNWRDVNKHLLNYYFNHWAGGMHLD